MKRQRRDQNIDTQVTATMAVDAAARSDDELDLSYMTQLWGSETTVKALLDAFVSSFREDLEALRAVAR